MISDIKGVGAEMLHHWDQLTNALCLKVLISTALAFFSAYTGGDSYILLVWFFMNFLDLLFGVARALIELDPDTGKNKFSRSRLYGWVTKTLTHGLTILVIALVASTLPLTQGGWLINGLLFILLLTEAASILDTAALLGLPVPPAAIVLVQHLRKGAEARLRNFNGGGQDETRGDN